tara:strand:- start:1719 stop:2156 length:438 start_codon:yes stop_codon:yes gene_type:complete
MKNCIKNITLIIMFFALTACAGSGYKNYSDLSSNLEPSENTKVFILRDMGFAGSAALVHINLNGNKVAELGEGEMTAVDGIIGSNVLEPEMGGIAGIGMEIPIVEFDMSAGENKYYIIGLKMGIIGSTMLINETMKDSWVRSAKD